MVIDIKSKNFSSSFFISSALFNPSPSISRWVGRIFGDQAVHFGDFDAAVHFVDFDALNIFNGKKVFKEHVGDRIKSNAFKPLCSFDLLGNIVLDNHPMSPFTSEYPMRKVKGAIRFVKPIIGTASLSIEDNTSNKTTIGEIVCYFRWLYSIWSSLPIKTSVPNIGSIFIYCPVFDYHLCKVDDLRYNRHYAKGRLLNGIVKLTSFFSHHNDSVDAIQLSSTFQSNFTFDSTSIPTDRSNTFIARKRKRNTKNLFSKAVCLVIPYTSSVAGKLDVYGAILVEWIRHYSELGFKVMIYDRSKLIVSIRFSCFYEIST